MKYKASMYNIMTENFDGCLLMANLLQTRFAKIKKEQKEEVKAELNKEVISLEFIQKYPYLLENKFIVPDDYNEYEIALLRYNEMVYSNDVLEITIIPTDACNFKCIYCYQEERDNKFMQAETKEAILKYLEKNAKKYKSVCIGWFGGEPLLMKELIVDFMVRANKICKKCNVPLVGKITTNGYELDIETFRKFISNKLIHFQITIDGSRENHNTQRPHKMYDDSYDKIMNNLKIIAQNETGYYRIALRINISHSILQNMDEYLEEMTTFAGNSRFAIHWQYIKDFGGEQVKKIEGNMIEGVKAYEEFIDKATQKNLGSFAMRLFQNGMGLCEAARKNSFFIDYDANVLKCTMAIYQKENKEKNVIGHINAKGDIVLDESKEAKWLVVNDIDEECKRCKFFPLCMAAVCPYSRKIKGKRVCCMEIEELPDLLRNIDRMNKLTEVGCSNVR